MEQTFEGILSSLLDSYEKGGGQDIQALPSEKCEELGLTEESIKLVKGASEYIDKFAEKAESLEAARDEGISMKRWLSEDLGNSMKELTNEEQVEIIDTLSKVSEGWIKQEESLEKLNKEEE